MFLILTLSRGESVPALGYAQMKRMQESVREEQAELATQKQALITKEDWLKEHREVRNKEQPT